MKVKELKRYGIRPFDVKEVIRAASSPTKKIEVFPMTAVTGYANYTDVALVAVLLLILGSLFPISSIKLNNH